LPIHLPNLITQLRDLLLIRGCVVIIALLIITRPIVTTPIVTLCIGLWSPPRRRAIRWIGLSKSAQEQHKRTAKYRQIFSHVHECFLESFSASDNVTTTELLRRRIDAIFYGIEP
jgi:hypothetical protein